MIKKRFQRDFGDCRLDKPAMCDARGLKSPLVFCADRICKRAKWRGKRCDEIVLSGEGDAKTDVYCIENKDGAPANLNAQYIREQLQGGAQILETLLDEKEEIHFMPVLATKSGVPPFLHRRLLQEEVKIRGAPKSIFVLKKGERLCCL